MNVHETADSANGRDNGKDHLIRFDTVLGLKYVDLSRYGCFPPLVNKLFIHACILPHQGALVSNRPFPFLIYEDDIVGMLLSIIRNREIMKSVVWFWLSFQVHVFNIPIVK